DPQMDRNDRNYPKPLAHDIRRPAAVPSACPADLLPDPAPPRSAPALRASLRRRDPTRLSTCSRRETLILFAGLALLSIPRAAAAADPLEMDTGPRLAARFADDPRLDQKISLTAWAEPLEDLLARLRRETGVQLTF